MANLKVTLSQNQMERRNDIKMILRFLQLFAEGHYADLQVYLQLYCHLKLLPRIIFDIKLIATITMIS